MKQLKTIARERFMKIYFEDPSKIPGLEQNYNEIKDDFNECWNQLKTKQEKLDFSNNLCYTKTEEGCQIYFHVYDFEKNCHRDIWLDEYRNTNRHKFDIYRY